MKLKQTNQDRKCKNCKKYTLLKVVSLLCKMEGPGIPGNHFLKLEDGREVPMVDRNVCMVCSNCYATFVGFDETGSKK